MKEHVKALVLLNTSVKVSYKRKIDEHYGELSLYKLNDELGDEYVVDRPYIKFMDLDEAVDYFCYHAYTSKNVGYVQKRLDDKKILNYDVHDLEKPNAKLKALFSTEAALVDEEAKALGIKEPKPFPKIEEAQKELDIIMKSNDLDAIAKDLKLFCIKYSTLDIFTHINAMYDAVSHGHKHDYSIGINLSEFSEKRVNELKLEKGNTKMPLKYKALRINVKISKDYKDYMK